MVFSGLSKVPDLDVLAYRYFQQVKGFRPLSEDVAHSKREKEGSMDHSNEYLYDSVIRHLQRTKQHKMREALSNGLTGSPLSPSVPGPLKGKYGKQRAKSGSSLAQRKRARG